MDDFKLLRVLFQHGRTTVYLAQHLHKKWGPQPIVLKRTELHGMALDSRRLAIQEANMLSRLKHPNIIRCLEFFEDHSEALVIVMEWAELGDLSSAWKVTVSSTEAVMDILIQMLLALRHLHSLGIIHRDVKTRNILASNLPQTGSLRVKLGDFGIARHTTRSGGMARTTIGTPLYCSPEVFGGQEYDSRADIWSLGCVVYELLAGHRPFQSGEFRELAEMVQLSAYPPLSKYQNRPVILSSFREIPYGLRDLVDSMLQPEAKRRPSALELLGHPFVKEHCHRLHKQLTQPQPPATPAPQVKSDPEFTGKFRALQLKLGTRGAAESFVELMAPEMNGELARVRGEAQLTELARRAWARRHSESAIKANPIQESYHQPSLASSVDELTMTIQQHLHL